MKMSDINDTNAEPIAEKLVTHFETMLRDTYYNLDINQGNLFLDKNCHPLIIDQGRIVQNVDYRDDFLDEIRGVGELFKDRRVIKTAIDKFVEKSRPPGPKTPTRWSPRANDAMYNLYGSYSSYSGLFGPTPSSAGSWAETLSSRRSTRSRSRAGEALDVRPLAPFHEPTSPITDGS
jgi:hypothetical protein